MAVKSNSPTSSMMVWDLRSPDTQFSLSSGDPTGMAVAMVTADTTGDDGPIDLSRNKDDESSPQPPVKRPDVPPLIPINRTLLKKKWLAQNHMRANQDSPIPSSSPPGCIPLSLIQAKSGHGKKRRSHEMNAQTDDYDYRMDNKGEVREEDSRLWDLRLDRAHSVPHLRSLPPLVRCKSLSESRIAPLYSEEEPQNESVSNRPVEWLLEQEQEIQRHRLQQIQIDLANYQSSSDTPDVAKTIPNYNSLLRVGYYTQMLQCFQAQEMLRRQFTLQQPDEHGEPLELRATAAGSAGATATTTQSSPQHNEETLGSVTESALSGDDERSNAVLDEHELRRRANRPLTGRHVRSGTGASPSTLLSLRKKIQARQQLRASSSSK